MARKTKEEALATRNRIIDAAERVFQRQGVSGTSLHQVAVAAGVTRGAVYWHFAGKAELFNAMMARVCLPIEQDSVLLAPTSRAAPLAAVRAHLLDILRRVANDEQVHRVFEVATQKVEYVDELVEVRKRHVELRNQHLLKLERLLRVAQRAGHVVSPPSARQHALGLHALLDGLMQNWMLDPTAFDLQRVGTRALDTQIAGLTAPTRPRPHTRSR